MQSSNVLRQSKATESTTNDGDRTQRSGGRRRRSVTHHADEPRRARRSGCGSERTGGLFIVSAAACDVCPFLGLRPRCLGVRARGSVSDHCVPLGSVWRGSLSLGGVLSIEIGHADTRVDLPRRGVRGSSIACCAGLESTPAYAPFLRPTRLAVGIPVSAQPSRAECELLLLLLARKCGGRGVRSWLSRSKSSGAPWRSRYGST